MSHGLDTIEIIPSHMASPARYSFCQVVQPMLAKLLSEEDRMILDFGCGTGIWRFLFKQDKKYIGFNLTDTQFSEKRERNVEFLLANGRYTPFRNDCFDFVFCNAVFEHISEDHLAARESFRVLKPGKYCCVIVPTNLSPIYDELPYLPFKLLGKHKGHGEHYYSRQRIVELLETSGFKIEHITFSLGFWGFVLKTLYMYQRVLRWYATLFVNKLLARNKNFNLYGNSRAWQAKSKIELQKICKEENKNLSAKHRLYRKLLAVALFLDKQLPVPFWGEWFIVCKKI